MQYYKLINLLLLFLLGFCVGNLYTCRKEREALKQQVRIQQTLIIDQTTEIDNNLTQLSKCSY